LSKNSGPTTVTGIGSWSCRKLDVGCSGTSPWNVSRACCISPGAKERGAQFAGSGNSTIIVSPLVPWSTTWKSESFSSLYPTTQASTV